MEEKWLMMSGVIQFFHFGRSVTPSFFGKNKKLQELLIYINNHV
jgi:hypothetical protein